jgi:hypothetical protein
MSGDLIILGTSATYLLVVIFGVLILLRFRLELAQDEDDFERLLAIEDGLGEPQNYGRYFPQAHSISQGVRKVF